MMREFFAESGHKLDTAYNGREGLANALRGGYDLMILDVMLPGLDGFAVLSNCRRKKNLPCHHVDGSRPAAGSYPRPQQRCG